MISAPFKGAFGVLKGVYRMTRASQRGWLTGGSIVLASAVILSLVGPSASVAAKPKTLTLVKYGGGSTVALDSSGNMATSWLKPGGKTIGYTTFSPKLQQTSKRTDKVPSEFGLPKGYGGPHPTFTLNNGMFVRALIASPFDKLIRVETFDKKGVVRVSKLLQKRLSHSP